MPIGRHEGTPQPAPTSRTGAVSQEPVLTAEERAIWSTMRMMGHLIERLRDRELAPHGITVQQSGILRHVSVMGNSASPSALARLMAREPTSVSALLNRMERQGLIRKAKHPHKKNQVVIRLTDKGKRLLAVSQERDSAARIMSRLSPEVRSRLLSGLLEFRKSLLQELAENYRAFHFETPES